MPKGISKKTKKKQNAKFRRRERDLLKWNPHMSKAHADSAFTKFIKSLTK